MHLFVIGATGRTGTHVVDLALKRGHHVTALVRDKARFARAHERLTVAEGNPLDASSLAAVLPAHDVVVSALGPRTGLFAKSTVVRDGAAATVAAMTRTGVNRLLFVSAATLFDLPFPMSMAKLILRNPMRDTLAAETIISASPLAWTFASPPSLKEGADETYRAALDAPVPGSWSMTFRAVAAYLVDEAEASQHARRIVGLAS
jgi:putative NADH-flavin reductase